MSTTVYIAEIHAKVTLNNKLQRHVIAGDNKLLSYVTTGSVLKPA